MADKILPLSVVDFIISVLTVIAERATVFPLIPPYVAGFVGFLAFVVWNGGIVLGQSVSINPLSNLPNWYSLDGPRLTGDKSNHVPAIHIPQLYYGVAFATAFGWPVLFTGRHGVFRLLKNIYLRSFWTKWLVPRPKAAVGTRGSNQKLRHYRYTSRTVFIMAFILLTTWKYT